MGQVTAKRFGLHWYTAALLCLFLQACVSDVKPTVRSEEELQPIRSVAILSTLNNQFTVTALGFSGGDQGLRPLTWDPNEYIISRVQSLLDPRYTIKPMENAEAFLHDQKSIEENKFDIKKAMANIPPRDDVDAYLVIVPALVSHALYVPGVGGMETSSGQGLVLQNHSGIFGRNQSIIYVHYTLHLVNAQTKAVLYDGLARIPKRDGIFYMTPEKFIKEPYPLNFAGFTDAEKQRLDSDFKELIDSSLTFSLQKMGLRR